jgi:hypothetical protein
LFGSGIYRDSVLVLFCYAKKAEGSTFSDEGTMILRKFLAF